ncbi:MAG: response regulator [Phycisphaeraceae bacterium]|nr:response regulator [Phycisphaeraceae bacterium]
MLVADDEHLVALGLVAILKELGHDVVGVADDGVKAIELARKHKPEVALLDIRMPKMNGIDVSLVLHEELAIPSIMVSAYSDNEHLAQIRQHGAETGIYGYLLKPVSGDDVRVALSIARQRSAVDGYRSHRIGQLEANLANRRTVEQAKWLMVEKLGITEPEAHEKLQRLARDSRRPLIDVAKEVIAAGGVIGKAN